MKRILFGLFAATLLCLSFAGCDNGTDGIEGDMYIEPGSHVFRSKTDTMVMLRVFGAEPPFVWSVADETMGVLSGVPARATTIDAATYTRTPGKYGSNTVSVIDNRGWIASCAITSLEEKKPEEEGEAGNK
ncbi:MAG: hypothetical protein ACOX5G_10400 [Kiritimatiellia bacterium]|jgi:hypothetical protein